MKTFKEIIFAVFVILILLIIAVVAYWVWGLSDTKDRVIYSIVIVAFIAVYYLFFRKPKKQL